MAKEALRAGRVDVLTLSPMEEPDIGINYFAYLAMQHNRNTRITIQEFWLPSDRAGGDWNAASIDHLLEIHHQYFTTMDQYVIDFNKKLHKPVLFVVPVGQAVIALREKIITGQATSLQQQSDLFTDKRGHPTPPLKALVSYCHFAVIYRRSPVGLPIPVTLSAAGYKNPDLNRLLQQLAWKAVIHHPLTGVADDTSSIQERAPNPAATDP